MNTHIEKKTSFQYKDNVNDFFFKIICVTVCKNVNDFTTKLMLNNMNLKMKFSDIYVYLMFLYRCGR